MEELDEKEDEKIEAMKPVKLVSIANSTEADMIINLLMNNEIPCFKKQNGSGSYMSLYYGFSIYGAEIYVDEQDYSRALEILQEINEINSSSDPNGKNSDYKINDDYKGSSDTIKDFAEEEEIEDDSYKNYAFYRNPRTIVRIYLAVMVGITIIAFIINAS